MRQLTEEDRAAMIDSVRAGLNCRIQRMRDEERDVVIASLKACARGTIGMAEAVAEQTRLSEAVRWLVREAKQDMALISRLESAKGLWIEDGEPNPEAVEPITMDVPNRESDGLRDQVTRLMEEDRAAGHARLEQSQHLWLGKRESSQVVK